MRVLLTFGACTLTASCGAQRQRTTLLPCPCLTHPPTPNPNLRTLAVTLGNIVAGALCMATVYSLAYGSLGKKVWKQ